MLDHEQELRFCKARRAAIAREFARLNPEQQRAVLATEGPLLLLAGAGSGKTTVLIHRIANLMKYGRGSDSPEVPQWVTGDDLTFLEGYAATGQGDRERQERLCRLDPAVPWSILAITFTNKAAGELKDRLAALLGPGAEDIWASTFHSACVRILRRDIERLGFASSFTIYDTDDSLRVIKDCLKDLNLDEKQFPPRTVLGYLSRAKDAMKLADQYLAECEKAGDYRLTRIAQVYVEYQRRLWEANALDFDDIILHTVRLLQQFDDVREYYQRKFRYVLIDEYQDTNNLQYLLASTLAGGYENFCVVGDDDQSIYRFRGATIENILSFEKQYPGCRTIRLEENYRSTKPVLDVANSLLAHAAESFRKTLFTRKEGGDPVRLVTPLSDMSQAKLVVRRIEELLDTHLPHEIAVLFRAGFHSYNLEMALNQTGIPFRKYGGLRYTEAAHVKDVIAYARLVLNPLDLPAFARVAALHSGIGPKTVQKLYAVALGGDAKAVEKAFARHPDLLEDMRFVDDLRARPQSPAALFGAVLEHYRPRLESTYPEDWPRRQQGLSELAHIASAYTELDLFVADLALESPEEDENDGEGRITLSTVHSAKGLEWNAVLIIDLVEDRFPSRHALARPEDFEEERRLMYVACTRARQDLELYAPAAIYSRAERGSLHVSQSPFVRELSPGLTEEWVEGFGGILSRRGSCFSGVGGVRGRLLPPARQAVPAFPGPAGEGTPFDDCQLLPESGSVSPFQAEVQDSADDATSPTASTPGTARLCHCRHRIFGRGKIIKHLPPDKVQVNFPGFGLKVILTEYLLMEN